MDISGAICYVRNLNKKDRLTLKDRKLVQEGLWGNMYVGVSGVGDHWWERGLVELEIS